MSGLPDRFRVKAEQKLPALYLVPLFALQVKAFSVHVHSINPDMDQDFHTVL